MIRAPDITGLVLAGGRGQRMGGADKGLLALEGRALAGHALERLRPQVGALLLSANRHLDAYRALGVAVCEDAHPFAGPLAGLHAGLVHCDTPWLLTVPCDAPFFPRDLAARLATALEGTTATMAIAWAAENDEGGTATTPRPQPVFGLVHRSLREPLAAFLAGGGRRASAWAQQAGALRVDFARPDLDAGAFRNINTPDELRALTRLG